MNTMQVICLPGSVAPAAQRYGPLVQAVGDSAELHLKELEVYREATPPSDYTIDEELEAVDRFADSMNLTRFHLVGYSGGGFISLAYAATRPQRIQSLGLFEPARIPGQLTNEEREFFSFLESRLRGLDGPEFMKVFVSEQVKPGVQVQPPPTAASPEMQKRPAGIAALIRQFDVFSFDRELFRACAFPVFYAYGDLSHDEQAMKAGILARLFPDVHVRRFSGVHHFVPPEQIYTPAHVRALTELWSAAESSFQ
jgi:pimeloyl-ACP methyl ester carboxylesterase